VDEHVAYEDTTSIPFIGIESATKAELFGVRAGVAVRPTDTAL
jgi:hypothetical protein